MNINNAPIIKTYESGYPMQQVAIQTNTAITKYGDASYSSSAFYTAIEKDILEKDAAYRAANKTHSLKNYKLVDSSTRYISKDYETVAPLFKYNITKKCDYFYEIEYDDDYSYSYANTYAKTKYIKQGGCSAFRKGNVVCRNYDWTYDEVAEFLMRIPARGERHASIAMCSGTNIMTKDVVENRKFLTDYDILPFLSVDGVNDAGVVCEGNVVPVGDKGITRGTNPDKPDLCAMFIVRFVLDYANSARHAIELLKNRNIYSVNSELINQEFHFMIADANETFVVEFVSDTPNGDAHMTVIEEFVDNKPIMTNFYLTDFDGSIGTMTPHGQGIERYNKIKSDYDSITDENSMVEAMNHVNYTRSYQFFTMPFWYSEYYDAHSEFGDLNKNSTISELTQSVNKETIKFANRTRVRGAENFGTWQTKHGSIIDTVQKKITVMVQENNDVKYVFSL